MQLNETIWLKFLFVFFISVAHGAYHIYSHCDRTSEQHAKIFSFPLYNAAVYAENILQVNICVCLPSVLSAPAKGDE